MRIFAIARHLVIVSAIVSTSADVFSADRQNGRNLYDKRGCGACHGGLRGNRLPGYPALNNRDANFIASELNKFRNDIRLDPAMNAMAYGLSDSDIEDIAAYISND